MKCTTVRTKLAGYLDDALTGTTSALEKAWMVVPQSDCVTPLRPTLVLTEERKPAPLGVRHFLACLP